MNQKKIFFIQSQATARARSLISEYPGYSLISEPITACGKHNLLVGYMLTVDNYFLLSNQSVRKVLLSNQSARKVLSTCLAKTNIA